MSPPNERELGALSANIAALTREVARDRAETERRHAENRDDRNKDSEKLDVLLGLKPMVEAHDVWIKGEGAQIAAIVRSGSAVTKAVYALCGLVGGGALMKLAGAFFAALPK